MPENDAPNIEPPAPPPKPPRRKWWKRLKPRRPIREILRLMLVRGYTLALFFAVAVICLIAIVYLFRSVFTPATLPPSLAQWQGSIDPAALREPHVPGVTDGAGRAPISHYHKVDRWFQVDIHNGCTLAGCHEPLPHTTRTKIAAFANLHVTFMDCKVCHEPLTGGPVAAHWTNLKTNQSQEAPAALRLMKLLEANHLSKEGARALNPQIIALVDATLAAVGANPTIEELRVEIDSSVPGSPVWLRAVRQLAQEIPLHARGEYGAKLARRTSGTDTQKMTEQSKTYLGSAPGSPSRAALETEIHGAVLKKPNACQACHSQAGVLDFDALGYSPKRALTLRTLPMVRLMEQIRQGESFKINTLIEANDGR